MDDLQQVAYEAKIQALEKRFDAEYDFARNLLEELEGVKSERSRLQTAYQEECAIVQRIWQALEIESYPEAHGKPIHELVAELKAEVSRLRLMVNEGR